MAFTSEFGNSNSNKKVTSLKNNSDLDYREYQDVLEEIREFITTKYSGLINKDDEQRKEQLRAYISKYIDDYGIIVKDKSKEDLVKDLISSTSGFDFLDKYLFNRNVEEININGWDSTRITFRDGHKEFAKEKFSSPEHAVNVIRKLLRKSNITFDSSKPIVRGHLSKNIRITAVGMGCIDSDKGVAVSIRIINPQNLTIDDFIKKGTGTKQMFDTLVLCYKYGISQCFAGPTNSGKTTSLTGILREAVSYDDRIVTIEEDVREFDLVKRKNGEVINEAIHLVTKHSEDSKQDIDQEKLLEISMTMNPDYFVISEMKGREAYEAQKAANTGHPFITSVHTNSCRDGYSRIVDLCKYKSNMDDKTLYNNVTKAFPIMVFQKRLKNFSRKILEITECVINSDEKREVRTLFEYKIDRQFKVDGKLQIEGRFEKVNNISDNLVKRLIENGITDEELDKILN
ncbi:CpaF family protein [Clostridioides sp. ZZV14-6044]|uniref:ATPase, T2SS/T4P/T4SS family n=1 Tax=Clostridioides sp. ZZV14-6044 TaxID=2811488 RepID=UPI001D1029F9|nr:CpaF family protein [Clostridioides sp. ZZV14-6044]